MELVVQQGMDPTRELRDRQLLLETQVPSTHSPLLLKLTEVLLKLTGSTFALKRSTFDFSFGGQRSSREAKGDSTHSACSPRPIQRPSGCLHPTFRTPNTWGYLAHKKPPPPLGPP